MTKGRVEAFSDGVLAIIITIMVLELRVPEGDTWQALRPVVPKIISYVFSFLYVGIYWNNHHHMFQAVETVNGKVLWANLFLLFWISLLPFATHWIGETNFAANPVAFYGFVLLMCAASFTVLMTVAKQTKGSKLAPAVKNQIKEYSSVVLYLVGIIASFFSPILGIVIFYVVALIWLVPDERIEKTLK